MSSWRSARRIWDISQVLRSALPVWPGDTSFAIERTWELGEEVPVNVSALKLSTHSGAHADAPLHYDGAGVDISQVELDAYIGECLVVDARESIGEIEVGDLPHLDSVDRVLFRTFERFPREEWVTDFTAIAADTIRWLAVQGVKLVGTDAPSIDPHDSKTMDAHHAVRDEDMRILEGLVLDDIAPGRYELIALPLAIEGADAAPVRAILRELA
ncbi:arylformamidase [Altererythrobacter aurantiacus]|uniref:Kynurenine formamidase n=1 Tax=Parapontixanthobacter aurantiacus TaxID=1463599 RepID=A0A844ZKH8_9SPHN|nr:arylformamidase [Parapontixanthobacter aurantiacus]MXO86199.1 arylformamidase [Parapontixanthobacter aurantiacus]